LGEHEEETMKTTILIRNVLFALPFLSLAACGQASTETREDAPLIAMATPATDSPGVYRAALRPASPTPRISEDVLRDPAQRFALMERLRTEIVGKTRRVPEVRWHNETRPALHRQLENAGLSHGDVDFLLGEVDQARAR
jgi:hypothetical protein